MTTEADSRYLIVITYKRKKTVWQIIDRTGNIILDGFKDVKYARQALSNLLDKEGDDETIN